MENIFIQLLFLLFLVGINAFFASSEMAIISLNDNKIKKLAGEGNRKAKLIDSLMSEPSRFLASIQVGVTLSGLLASAFAAENFATKLTSFLINSGLNVSESIVKLTSVVLITVVLSYITLVFGELVPKRLAMQNPERISMIVIDPLNALTKIANPFVKLLALSTNLVIKIFGGNVNVDEDKITEEEIRMMIDLGREKGVIQNTEKEMIDNIFNFHETSVNEIMTPRTDIIALPMQVTLEEVLAVTIEEKYSRVPIYQDHIDNIIGILYVKDLFELIVNPEDTFSLEKIIKPAYFVPEYIKSSILFKEMQKNKNHMAIVIDEYGGTAGLVTMEDLIEEVVGNIFDEYDEDKKEIERVDENTFIVDGSVSLDKIEQLLDIELPTEIYDTLNGFLVGLIGKIPKKDELREDLSYEGFLFKIKEVKNKRISVVEIVKIGSQ